MVNLDFNPPVKHLRQFKWICLPFFVLLAIFLVKLLPKFGIEIFTKHKETIYTAAVALGIILFILGQINPRLLKYVFIGVMLLVFPIGLIVGNLLLLLIFCCIFVPIGIIFKIIGRDELKLKEPKNASGGKLNSYWLESEKVTDPARYFKQF